MFTAILLAAIFLLSLTLPALADDTATWGVSMQRTRRIDSLDAAYQHYLAYSPTAQYCPS